MYYIYMLRCEDNSIYTGITTNLERRMKEHSSKDKKCAKYTQKHTVIRLEIAWETQDRALASKLEYHIKTLRKLQKEELIKEPEKLQKLLGEKINGNHYLVIT